MTDGIIKGTGNSRYLKSVSDVLARYPTHESLMQALADGTFPVDFNGINSAGWSTQGTKLNKANLLTDALCTNLGLATTASPTQAMDKLRTMVSSAQTALSTKGNCHIYTGSYSGNGTYGESNKNILNFPSLPWVLIISGTTLFVRGAKGGYKFANGSSTYINAIFDGTSVQWWYNYNANEQSNVSGNTYNYVAFY